MTIQLRGWNDGNDYFRKQIISDVIEIMFRYFHNDALLNNDLQIISLHASDCPYADKNPCTHYDRSCVCLNVDGAYWCQFVHQLSHELCHCSTSRRTFPQKIKWFDEFICCCSSFLVETIMATESSQKYDYMFMEKTSEVFSSYIGIKESEHIYEVDNVQEFFSRYRESYQQDENLIKKHDVYVRKLFEFLRGDFSGLSFVGKMYLVPIDNDMIIEQYLQRLLQICDEKERAIIYQICNIFGLKVLQEIK